MADTQWRTLAPGQRSDVWVADAAGGEPRLVHSTDRILLEAPNWGRDGALYLNGDGRLWRLPLGAETDAGAGDAAAHGDSDTGAQDPRKVPFTDLPPINNDHVLSPDGSSVFMSAVDRAIYRGSLEGGAVTRVTPDDGTWHFLHGVSADSSRLAYVAISTFDLPGRLVVAPASLDADGSGAAVVVDTGEGHIDGPEWDAANEWIYFNTERFTDQPGHAQLARIPDGGSAADVERLVASGTVDWFPHPSPSGEFATYIAFPSGTLGHPADLDVEVRLVQASDWSTPIARYPLRGGQGTINVNSWAADSSAFAFVSYPVA